MYERFTKAARQIMVSASQEAARADDQYIGSGHILAALAADDSVAAQMLQMRGIDAEKIRAEVKRLPAIVMYSATGAKGVIERAMLAARKLFHHEVDSAHVLLALLEDPDSVAASVLVSLGFEPADLRNDLLSRLPPGSAENISRRRALEIRFMDDSRVQALKRDIAALQAKLEQAVKATDFNLAASFRDQRLAVERALNDLFTELGREQA